MSSTLKTAADFRKHLEKNLQTQSIKTGESIHRLRRKVAFDRLLARIFTQEPSSFFLKGGYAMELRIAHARATKDLIDLLLLLKTKNRTPEAFQHTLQRVFRARNTHLLPEILPEPPVSWHKPFAEMAVECGISQSLKDGFTKVSEFYNVLQGMNKSKKGIVMKNSLPDLHDRAEQ